MRVFLTKCKLSDLNFLFYQKKNYEKSKFFKTFKGLHFSLDGPGNISYTFRCNYKVYFDQNTLSGKKKSGKSD